eukprot:jgi/Chlat1/2585/Chrsp178S02492
MTKMFAEAGSEANRVIAEGSLVIVYERYDRMKGVFVRRGDMFQNRYGTFRHEDWIGTSYGSKVVAHKGEGWVYLLAPTPELWTLVLQHRTQILYLADISLVTTFLDLRPGCVVLESGTGSASLTHSLARAVMPGGRVRTFEFHAQRAELAAAELTRNCGDAVEVAVCDVEKELNGAADAVFLDLPGPWRAVPAAAAALKPDGAFCAFSPCIEQVQQTCIALRTGGFTDVRTMEVLLRTYEVKLEHYSTQFADGSDAAYHQDPRSRKRQRNGSNAAQGEGGEVDTKQGESLAGSQALVVARPNTETKGHTGYLTFARRVS